MARKALKFYHLVVIEKPLQIPQLANRIDQEMMTCPMKSHNHKQNG
jgi:hypothetical protein